MMMLRRWCGRRAIDELQVANDALGREIGSSGHGKDQVENANDEKQHKVAADLLAAEAKWKAHLARTLARVDSIILTQLAAATQCVLDVVARHQHQRFAIVVVVCKCWLAAHRF